MKKLALSECEKVKGAERNHSSYQKIYSRYLSTVNNMRSSGYLRREILNFLDQQRDSMYTIVDLTVFVPESSCVSFKVVSDLIRAIENDKLNF